MTDEARGNGLARGRPAAPATPAADGWGWYLYGIIRRREPGGANLAGELAEAFCQAADEWRQRYREEAGLTIGPGLDVGESVRLLQHGDLAAVVSLVPLRDFGSEAIHTHLADAAWLEAMVRGHQRVVDSVHRERTVLPAKFGCVYASADDVAAALGRGHGALLAQLRCLEERDEWGVRLYADRKIVERRAARDDPAARDLQQKLLVATPGRAFFLKRKLADALAAATDQSLAELAQAGYDRLARCADDSQVATRGDAPHAADGEAEILRAAFLVRRADADALVAEVRRLAEGQEGLRAEYSGPWPPYSFAAPASGLPAQEEAPR